MSTPENTDAPSFDEAGRLIAPQFDDLYFSAHDGLAETRHVFLQGNQLPECFAALKSGEVFTIGETGFGTGLNFLAAWQRFEQLAHPNARLEFVSVEGYPLLAATIERVLSAWPELTTYREQLLTQYTGMWPGVHRFRFAHGRVRLTLLVGQVAETLESLDASVDAWFLDGFTPARNPDMWSDEVFAHVARCSSMAASLATFTAAGFVRRGLAAAGFEIQKRSGFGTKRDMTVGRWLGGRGSRRAASDRSDAARREPRPPGNIHDQTAVVVGGSIAGAFAARSLAERGVPVTVIEKQRRVDGELPSLSPRIAAVQPKVGDWSRPENSLVNEGYAFVQRLFSSDKTVADAAAWNSCGSFRASLDAKTERKLRRFIESAGALLADDWRWIAPWQTEAELGVPLGVGGVVFEGAGICRPAGLCRALLDHPAITVRDGVAVEALQQRNGLWVATLSDHSVVSADVAVVANAMQAAALDLPGYQPPQPVRGQATILTSPEEAGQLANLRRAIFYGGYVSPACGGVQMLGSTYGYGQTDTQWRDVEHVEVCEKLARVLPEDAQRLRALDNPAGWVGIRATPIHGKAHIADALPGLYFSDRHGSHGIASAAAVGEHLACLITDAPRHAPR